MGEQVKVGQVWEDNDSRLGAGAHRRSFKVLEIIGERALVVTLNGVSRKTKIKLDRFRPTATGYRLVQDT